MLIIAYSAAAGIFGTGIGGLLTAFLLKKPTEKVISCILMFAAGVMTSIVCFGLVPESINLAGVVYSVAGLIIGVLVIMLLNRAVDRITTAKNGDMAVHQTHEELYHESNIIKEADDRSRLLHSGIVMLVAIGLHNIPEGLAIGAGGSLNIRLGIVLAVMIALHNIPEGMAIAAPLSAAGIGRWKVIGITSLSGAPTLIGGIIGVFVGGVSEFALAMSLSAAGGAMLYVVFGEIIPQSIVMTKSRLPSIVALFGVLLGLLLTQF